MNHVDVAVIGSGYGGAVTAARLAEAGLRVRLLERGPWMQARELKQTDDPRYVPTVLDAVVSSDNVLFRTGKLVGGASICMDGAHFRVPQKSYEAKDGSGRRYWPELYSAASMSPYMDRAEAMLKVRQFPWSEVSKAGGLFAKMLDKVGATCERARMAYTDCLQCGFCAQGCLFEKKVTMLHSYLPLALAKGAVVEARADVHHLEPSGTGYSILYKRDGLDLSLFAERVIVAGGGIHSPAILLRSRPWLPRLSAQVGENFNNNGEHAFLGILPPEFDDLDSYYCYKGAENACVMSFHWFESEGFSLHPGGGMEPAIFTAEVAAPNHPVLPARSWGMDYKRFVESVYPHRAIGFSSLGLVPGHRAVALKPDGSPTLVPRDRTAYDAYLDRVESVVYEVGRRTRVTLVPTTQRKLAGTTSAHLLAACRMGESPAQGVIDADCQVHGYQNLYVVDASSIPYALGTNPALAITAIAERASERIVQRG